MIKIQKFVFNPFLENTYIVWDDVSKDAIIIDPGCSNNHEEKLLSEFINNYKLSLNIIINTHCHIDHIFGNYFLKQKYNAKLIAPEKDLFLLDIMKEQAENFGVKFIPSPYPDELLTDDLKLNLGKSKINFLFTPGHTPGEYCIYFEDEKICFTGDVLFKGSIGRTDLWGGSYVELLNSIKTTLFNLPDDVRILPGHDEESTIGYEKKSNPYLLQFA